MAHLVVRLLGGFRVELDGEPVYGFETDKARALLAYLIVEADRPHRRETLAGLLWPDRPDSAARNSLRHTVFRVRQALAGHDRLASEPAPFLFVTPMDVQFNTASDYSLDVAELEALARHDVGNSPAGGLGRPPQLLREAFCGEFLAGFSVPDSEAFEAWMLSRQEYCHRLTLDILDAQNRAFEDLGDYEKAVAAARLQLKLEPWLEEAHRRCMRGLALAGRRDEALRQHEACCRALQAELGVEPAAITQELFTSIRAGKLLAPPRATAAVPRGAPPDPQSAEPAAGPMPSVEAGRVAELPTRAPVRVVAREHELGHLCRHLAAALCGETGVVFVSGDPGSGKTALVEAFAASAMAQNGELLVAGARCNPHGQADPLAPLRKLAEMLFGDLADELAWRLPGREQVDRLQRATNLTVAALEEYGAGLIGTLVPAASVSRRAGLSVGPATPDSAPQPTQAALFDQLTRTLAAIARRRPLLLLLDDLHWVDDATAAFLLHLGRQLNGSRVLVLGAYRLTAISTGRRDARTGEASRHPLVEVINELRSARGEITVDLDRSDGHAFVEAYVDMEPNRLGARFRDALYAQTGGHALFTIELLRDLQGQGQILKDEAGRWAAQESLDWGALPARVEAVIAERIDRLPEAERRLLWAASVQGDEFAGEVVAELTGLPLGDVIAALSGSLARQHHLVRPEGLQRFGGERRSIYRFTHHLFQKYLYNRLDPLERAQMHSGVAASLDRQATAGGDPAERERLGAELARHYEAGGLPLQAARALLDAGRQATRVSAFREALSLFDHGLALLESEPRSTGRTEIQRLLQVARLMPQRILAGSGSTELEGSLARAIKTGAGDTQDRSKLMTIEAELDHLVARGQLEEVRRVAARMLDLAAQMGDQSFVAMAQFWLGFAANLKGDPQQAESDFRWIFAEHAQGRWTDLRGVVGFDVMPHALTFSAIGQFFLGHPEQALKQSAQAVAAAQELSDMYGLAFASACGCMTLFLLRSGGPALQERSGLSVRHCEQHGFAWWQHYAEAFPAWLAVMRGELDDGINRIEKAIAAWQATGMVVGTDSLMVVLANAYLEAARQWGEREGAAAGAGRPALLTKALETIDGWIGPDVAAGQGYQAELYRLRGELLLARDGLAASAEALDCFRQAMELGREKGALAWELRAAMSLVRLRERQGEAHGGELAEARSTLRDIYGRFREGFAFADLQDAARLIGKAV